MKTISILGAKGRISSAVAKAFHHAGWHVIAVSRTGKIDSLPTGIEQRSADAMNKQELIDACAGSDVIFNGVNPPYPEWSRYCMPMAKNVIDAAKATSATHLFIGNVYNFGSAIGQDMKETDPQNPDTKKGKIRFEMERLFQEASKNGVQTLIIRSGDFFGGVNKGSWFDLVITSKLCKGTFTYPGPTHLPHAWAYLPDLATAFVRIADKAPQLPLFDSFHFEGLSLSGDDLKTLCEASMEKTLKRASVPWIMLKIGGLVVPMLREVVEMSYLWHTAHSFNGGKLKKLIGNDFSTPAPQAIHQALIDLKIVSHLGAKTAA